MYFLLSDHTTYYTHTLYRPRQRLHRDCIINFATINASHDNVECIAADDLFRLKVDSFTKLGVSNEGADIGADPVGLDDVTWLEDI